MGKIILPEKLEHTVGCEWTWLLPFNPRAPLWHTGRRGDTQVQHSRMLGEHYQLNGISDQIERAIPQFQRVYVDYGTLETSSAPRPTLLDLQGDWQVAKAAVRRYGLQTHRQDTMSGGGHVHIGLQKDSTFGENPLRSATSRAVYMALFSRPFLNWIFNHPLDDTEANWMGGTYQRYIQPKWKAFSDRKWGIELRFFDMPRTWREAKLHILFADRFLSWAEANTVKLQDAYENLPAPSHGVNCTCYSCDIARSKLARPGALRRLFPPKKAVRGFNELLEQLALPRKPYELFVQRNLPDRYKFGTTT